MFFFIHWAGLGHQTQTYYVDSTKLPVCDNHRIHQHKVLKAIAKRGKTSMGWFYGLKLHLLINGQGGRMGFCFTTGNVSDNNAEVVGTLCQNLHEGKVFGDAGYISRQLFEHLYQQGLTLLTKIRKNMKNKLIQMKDKFLLKKRTVIETVIDLLKNIFDLWHTRHRSIDNAFNNTLACLAAYGFLEQKPSISQNYTKRNTMLSLINLSN
jgi:hypothetical protein